MHSLSLSFCRPFTVCRRVFVFLMSDLIAERVMPGLPAESLAVLSQASKALQASETPSPPGPPSGLNGVAPAVPVYCMHM